MICCQPVRWCSHIFIVATSLEVTWLVAKLFNNHVKKNGAFKSTQPQPYEWFKRNFKRASESTRKAIVHCFHNTYISVWRILPEISNALILIILEKWGMSYAHSTVDQFLWHKTIAYVYNVFRLLWVRVVFSSGRGYDKLEWLGNW